MKKNLPILTQLAVLTAFMVAFSHCCPCPDCKPAYDPKEECTQQIRTKEQGSFERKYRCHQVVVDMSIDGPKKANWLRDKGFKPVDTCSCNGSIQLWEAPQSIETLTSGETTTSKTGVNGDSCSLNYVFEFVPDSLNPSVGNIPPKYLPVPPSGSNVTVKVAIVDTGVDPSHSTLAPFIWHNPLPDNTCAPGGLFGFNFADPTPAPTDQNSHGTMVNGVITGVPANSVPDSNITLKLMNLKVTPGSSRSGTLFDGVCGIYFAIQNGAKVINLSWGFNDEVVPKALIPVLEEARKNNVLIVASSGNSKKNNDQDFHWPSGFSEDPNFDVVATAATNGGSTLWVDPVDSNKGSNFGKNTVTLAAPGLELETTSLSNKFAKMTGTSAAAPFVSRRAAVIIGLHPNLTAADVKKRLVSEATTTLSDPTKPAGSGAMQ